MIPTLYNFTQALLHPARSFTTLGDAHAVCDASGIPRIVRTSRFAEAQIEWQGAQWLLCMPLSSAAVVEIERPATHLKTLRSEWLADYRLLRAEMQYETSTGAKQTCDMVLQHLPAGEPFVNAMAYEQPQTLLAAIDALEQELTRLNLSHRNLKVENLRWCGRKLIPIRHHYTRMGAGADAEALQALREQISTGPDVDQTMHDTQASYGSPRDRYTGHLWVGNVFEQLICVEDKTGYGYVDTSNREVIASHFLWADDFHEGRAAVETAQGMGLIDKQGRMIIPAHYEIVEYDVQSGRSQVRQNELWAEFDYEGRQLSEFK